MQENLGKVYFHRGTTYTRAKQYTAALESFKQASECNHPEACFEVAEMYYHGTGIKQDHTIAFEYYKKAGSKGHLLSQFKTGVMYAEGDGVQKDAEMALRWLSPASISGMSQVNKYIADIYYQGGQNVPVDYKNALYWFEKSPQDVDCQEKMALMYRTGHASFPPDWEKARTYYLQAATGGNVNCQYDLGSFYLSGDLGFTQNIMESIKWFTMASEQQDVKSLVCLGIIYLYGFNEAKKDRNKAFSYFETALKTHSENGQANFYMGEFYSLADTPDYTNAIKHYRKAAEVNDGDAANALGKSYELGLGVKVNLTESIVWYEKAHKAGNEEAEKNLERTSNKIETLKASLGYDEMKTIQDELTTTKEKLAKITKTLEERDATLAEKTAEVKAKKADITKLNEEARKKNETLKKKKEEVKTKIEEMKKKDDIIKAKNAEIKKKDEEIKKKNEEIKKRDVEKNSALKEKDDALAEKEEELKSRGLLLIERNKELQEKTLASTKDQQELLTRSKQIQSLYSLLEKSNALLEQRNQKVLAQQLLTADASKAESQLIEKTKELHKTQMEFQTLKAKNKSITETYNAILTKFKKLSDDLGRFDSYKDKLQSYEDKLYEKDRELAYKTLEINKKNHEMEGISVKLSNVISKHQELTTTAGRLNEEIDVLTISNKDLTERNRLLELKERKATRRLQEIQTMNRQNLLTDVEDREPQIMIKNEPCDEKQMSVVGIVGIADEMSNLRKQLEQKENTIRSLRIEKQQLQLFQMQLVLKMSENETNKRRRLELTD